MCGVCMQRPCNVCKVGREVGSYTCSVNLTLPVVTFHLYSGFIRQLDRGDRLHVPQVVSGAQVGLLILFLLEMIFNSQGISEIQFPSI